MGPSRARESGRRPSARLQTARYTIPTVPPPWRNIDSSSANAPSPWKPFSWTIAQYVQQLSPWQTLRRLGCRRVSIKTSSANDTAQVTLVSALAHDWYLLCKPLARSRASQHGTRKTAAARLHLRVRRRQLERNYLASPVVFPQPAGSAASSCNALQARKRGAADCGIDRETDSIAARGAGSTTVRDAFRCGPLQVVAPLSWRLEQASHETSESRPLHPLRKAAYRAGGSMLLTMRAHSACPLPIPECRSAVVTTLPAPPSALALVYSNIANCQPMAVTTVLGNLDAGNLAAAVSARERNNERVISRNRAPATICSAVSRRASRTRRRHPPSTSRLLRRPVGNPRSRSHRSSSRVRLILRPYDCDPIIQYCGVLSR